MNSEQNSGRGFQVLELILLLVAIGVIVFLVWPKSPVTPTDETPTQVACTMEAKLCADGSYVGRSGPNCEFAKCPDTVVTPTKPPVILVTNSAKINQKILVNSILITPLEVTQDSRCPVDVQCVWAGTVNLSVRLTNDNGDPQISTLTLGTPIIFSGKQVTLENVMPIKHSGTVVSANEYVFTFSVK